MALGLVLLLALLLPAWLYWQLIIAEGVYLGPRVVRLLYDWTARRYDAIKCFEAESEKWFLGEPLAGALVNLSSPRVLDVACGTGRLPKTLLAQPGFSGQIIGLDASRQMLKEAARALGDRVWFIWQSAERLPFEESTFDAVTCLEALEFMPGPAQALTEMARVLRPGGLLLISNRIGPWTRWMPGHTMSTPALMRLLETLGFERVKMHAWQVEYDLVWAIRSGRREGVRTEAFFLVCPHCQAHLESGPQAWWCKTCRRVYPIAADGVLEMLER